MLNVKTLSKAEKKALEEFKRRLFKKLGKKVVSIRLFGSKARGDSTKESDIDVLVVTSKKDRKDWDEVYKIVSEILLEYQLYLSVKVFSYREFRYLNSIPTTFMGNVAKEGIAL